MNRDRYNELIAMSISGDLNLPENRALLDELQNFEHRSWVILQTYLIDNNSTIDDARTQLEQLSPAERLDIIFSNLDIVASPAAEAYLKTGGL